MIDELSYGFVRRFVIFYHHNLISNLSNVLIFVLKLYENIYVHNITYECRLLLVYDD